MQLFIKMKHSTKNEAVHTTIMHKDESEKIIPVINLLFTDHGASSERFVVKSAIHNFWQMELVDEGAVIVYIEKSKFVLPAKKILIIPPGVKHGFSYSVARKTWSFKFNLSNVEFDNPQAMVLPEENSTAMRKFCDLFFTLIDGYQQIPNILYPALESLIGGIIAMSYTKSLSDGNAPEWIAAAKEFIVVNVGENINLEDLARHLNYTRVHLSRLCRKHLDMRLKDFFDREIASIARKKLLYSSKNITTIARETGFNDVYSFSRFYKRVTSMTPSEQRKKTQ